MYKANRNVLPMKVQSLFIKADTNQVYNLRNEGKFKHKYARTALKARSFSVKGIKIFNEIPNCIRNSNSIDEFKAMFKKHFLENY